MFTAENNVVNTGLVERVIPQLVSVDDNLALTVVPSEEEIFKQFVQWILLVRLARTVLEVVFFVNCGNIVCPEVVNVVRSFF